MILFEKDKKSFLRNEWEKIIIKQIDFNELKSDKKKIILKDKSDIENFIKKFKEKEISLDNLINYLVILITYERIDILKYVYKKTEISLQFIEEIIKILEMKKSKLNKLKQAQYFIEHQIL